jgi:hypothetical protein
MDMGKSIILNLFNFDSTSSRFITWTIKVKGIFEKYLFKFDLSFDFQSLEKKEYSALRI